MKTNRLLITFFAFFCMILVQAQTDDFFTVQGIVKDAKSRKSLENVSISLTGTNVGTITNRDGIFSLKIKKNGKSANLKFSHLGYNSLHMKITEFASNETQNVWMQPKAVNMGEVIVTPDNPVKIVETALEKIKDNYPAHPTFLTAFYRETVQKRKRYISVSEAVINLEKAAYGHLTGREKVYILQGRKLVSPKMKDTLSVKLQGGPLQGLDLDFMQVKWPLLERDNLIWYHFTLEDYATIDGRLHYKIHFSSIIKQPFPMISGYYYIDKESYSLNRMELTTDMIDTDKVTEQILKKKPAGMRFRPQELSYLILYKTIDGKTQIDYACSTLKFQCDWKKKLFHTNYTVTSETAITDRANGKAEHSNLGKPFRMNYILSDKIDNFSDNGFWKDYNIIEPTESLKDAVNKLKKSYK